MKKTTLLFLFITAMSHAQLKFVDMPDVKLVGSSNGITCEKVGENHIFSFRDAKYISIDKYQEFKVPSKDFSELFVFLNDGFREIPKKATWIDLGNDLLAISYSKLLGVVSVRFTVVKNKNDDLMYFSNSLTKKQFLKLFGVEKKKKDS